MNRAFMVLSVVLCSSPCVFGGFIGTVAPSTIDLWDISQGTQITGHSPTLTREGGSDIRDMFGGQLSAVETGNTLFQDQLPAGTLHWVEWQTNTPVTVDQFNLIAAHDAPPRDATARGFSEFKLFAGSSATDLVQVFHLTPPNPYEPSNPFLRFTSALNSVNGQYFRAEFVQLGPPSTHSGPRIIELDGFGTTGISIPAEEQINPLSEFGLSNTYNLSFDSDVLQIGLDIALAGFIPDIELLERWEQGAEEIWSKPFEIVDPTTGRRYSIILDVDFVNDDADITINVHDGTQFGEINRPNVLNWYTQSLNPFFNHEGFAAHEVGHMIGNFDEYPPPGGTRDPVTDLRDETSIMADYKGSPKERHYQHFLDWFNDRTGLDFVLGQAPSYSGGESGEPIVEGDINSVPEPTSIALVTVAVLVVLPLGIRRKLDTTKGKL